MTKLAANLRDLMAKARLDTVQLAKKTRQMRIRSVAQPYISQLRNGSRENVSLDIALALAAALKCTLYELTGDERLRDVEADMAKIKDIPPEAEELWEAYKSLDDDNPVKHFIEATLLGKKPNEPNGDNQHDEPEKAG